MYEQHYGLNRRPFRAAATGSDVFVGPQTAKTMQAMKKALTAGDAVVAVTGATGVGKTTLVNRALDAIDGNAFIVRIGRMQLGHDEVLDFLLDELAAENVPASTIRKITLLKRLLAERTASGSRVFVVIEDAVRVGEDALAELEALTAADGGDSDGANLVLMGSEASLKDVLSCAPLTRLKQRVRLYHAVEPFVAAELLGYFRHCFRLAGGDFDAVFDERCARFIHALTEGVPRIANNLVESALNAGSEKKLAQIDLALVARVANEEYGLTAELPALSDTATAGNAEPEPTPDRNASKPSQPETLRPDPVKEEPDAPIERTAQPQPSATSAAPESEADAPELIQDTVPDLAVLTADLAPDAPADQQDDADDEIPTLFSSGRMHTPELQPRAPDASLASEPQAKPVPVAAKPEPEPPASVPQLEPEPVQADPEPEPVAAVPDPEPFPAAPEPEPVPASPEAEPVAAAPEPAPVAAAPQPKPEPVAAAPEPKPEPAAAATEPMPATPEPAPVVAAQEPEPVPAAPEPKPEAEAEVAAPEPVADCDRDPTLAELRPDLDALEEAMASLAEQDAEVSPSVGELPEPEPQSNAEPVPGPAADDPAEPEVADMTKPELPHITLDAAIQENIAEATAALEKHDATIAEDTVTEESSEVAAAAPDPKEKISTKSTAELRSIASGLSKAKSLEDVDDAMAETLFGTGINTIAAQVLAAGPDNEPANESVENTQPRAVDSVPQPAQDIELELVAETINEAPTAVPADASAAVAETPAADKSELEKEFMDVYGENALEVSLETDSPKAGLDLSASQRLATVRALNAEQLPAGAMPPSPAASSPTDGAAPAPIEDQIKTSMTQTLATLSVRPTAASDDDDDDEDEDEETQKKRGFFSRFRRS